VVDIRVNNRPATTSALLSSPSLEVSPFWDPVKETQWSPMRPYYLQFNDSYTVPGATTTITTQTNNNNNNLFPQLIELTTVKTKEKLLENGTILIPATKKRYINNFTWDPRTPILIQTLSETVVWNLKGTHKHPLHVHVNAMQIVQKGGCGRRYEEGEFYDTISSAGSDDNDDDTCLVRIYFADFVGRMALHCHRFVHEDSGMMTWVNVTATT